MTETTHVSPTLDEYPDRPWPAVWTLVLGFVMIMIDSTVVTVAMPSIMSGLHTDLGGAMWVTSGYLLAYAVPLLIFGALGDRFGPKRLYIAGLGVFTGASLLCGLSTSIGMLIGARVLQGLGGAMMSPQTMAITTRLFPPHRRGAAMGVWGAAAGVSALLGPILGGILVDGVGWEWIFFINLPIGVLAMVLALRNVPLLPTHAHRLDVLGVILSGVGMFALVFGLEEAQSYHWNATIWTLVVVGVVIMGLFVAWQGLQKGEPLVPLSLFVDRNFSIANICIVAMGYLVTSMVFPVVLYTQTVRGLSPTHAALLTLPSAVISGILSPFVGRVLNRRNPRWFIVAGFAAMLLGMVLYVVLIAPGKSVLLLLIPSAVLGLGNSVIWGPLSMAATRNLPLRHAGAGSGVYNTTRQMGAVLGSAMIAMFMANRLAANLPAGASAGGAPQGGHMPSFIADRFTTALSQALWLPLTAAAIGMIAALFIAPVSRVADVADKESA